MCNEPRAWKPKAIEGADLKLYCFNFRLSEGCVVGSSRMHVNDHLCISQIQEREYSTATLPLFRVRVQTKSVEFYDVLSRPVLDTGIVRRERDLDVRLY
jgi:hypothetical protein